MENSPYPSVDSKTAYSRGWGRMDVELGTDGNPLGKSLRGAHPQWEAVRESFIKIVPRTLSLIR